MTIETKYSINEKVWVMHDNNIKQAEINKIDILIMPKATSIHYFLFGPIAGYNHDLFPYGVKEDRLFTSKEELLKTLQ